MRTVVARQNLSALVAGTLALGAVLVGSSPALAGSTQGSTQTTSASATAGGIAAGSVVVTPSGQTITLSKDLKDYSTAELVAIGLGPNQNPEGTSGTTTVKKSGGVTTNSAVISDGRITLVVDGYGLTISSRRSTLHSNKYQTDVYPIFSEKGANGSFNIYRTGSPLIAHPAEDITYDWGGRTYSQNTTLCSQWSHFDGNPCVNIHR